MYLTTEICKCHTVIFIILSVLLLLNLTIGVLYTLLHKGIEKVHFNAHKNYFSPQGGIFKFTAGLLVVSTSKSPLSKPSYLHQPV